ncbi:hypothetical protein LTR10_001894 [Elasticomyces elasticus]|nr:hypothetical protein LTR10_001894 [Elasticomyces elasticus]KAK4975393.1 hypothetical protein LTR42_004603 [Elasticomyces elasticus]
MSGVAEAATVYSLVTGTIEIIKTAIEIWEAVKDKDKLPRQLRVVAEKLPSIQQLLATSEQQYQLKRLPDSQWVTAKQNVERCRTGCEDIRGIFDKAFPSNANAVQRAWTGTVTVLSGRGKKAEELFREVYQELEILGQYHIVTNIDILAQLKAAVEQLGASDKTTYQHYGAGPLSVNASTGTQHVNTNSGSGNWFQGPVNNPTFHSVVHYGWSEGGSSGSGVRERFLDSLWFPEIDQRRNEVKTACPNTLDWIFTEEPPNCGPNPRRPWASFASWLRSDACMYWISGKAGSGNSTLMSHLLKDHRTVEALESWANGCELLRLNYFFWRPGSALQNSVEGLLRTVAFQLCNHVPEAIDAIMREPQYAMSRLPSWTERTLRSAIKTAIGIAESYHWYISIFVDGLDEYQGEHGELVDLIFELQAFSNVKCCVASRPEVVLHTRLKDKPFLRLQDLNKRDIKHFVAARLTPLPRHHHDIHRLQETIVTRAEGVFLWAVLVIPPVNKDIQSGDDLKTLLDRIDQLPRDLEQLFVRMVESIETHHQRLLAFYLRCVESLSRSGPDNAWTAFPYPDVVLLTAARLTHPIESYATFTELCHQTELQVMGYSAGLLEIRPQEQSPDERKLWETNDTKFFVPELLGETRSLSDRLGRRESRSVPYHYPEVLHFSTRQVGWIHRSAYDFVFPSDGRPFPLGLDVDGHLETLKHLAQTAVELWTIMPNIATGSQSGHSADLASICMCAEVARLGDSQAAYSIMDLLHRHVLWRDPRELHFWERSFWKLSDTDGGRIPDRPIEHFWRQVHHVYSSYIMPHFDVMLADLPSTAQQASMLYHLKYGAHFDSDDTFVHLRLLETICLKATLALADEQDSHRTFLRVAGCQLFGVRCVPTNIQHGLDVEEEPEFFLDLIQVIGGIMHIPLIPEVVIPIDPMATGYFEYLSPTSFQMKRAFFDSLWALLTAGKARYYIGNRHGPRKPWPYEALPHYQLFLQIPWKLVLAPTGARHAYVSDDPAREWSAQLPLEVRIMCATHIDHGLTETYDSIEFCLHNDIAKVLASMLLWEQDSDNGIARLFIHGSEDEYTNLLASILDDIKANKQGLNVIQQLALYAHVELYLEDFWLYLESESDDSDDLTSDGRSPTID